ncbi:MAG: TRAM domain-containing protein [Actinobacteria bacterium]|nr:MAG: TRAM domain-containing protein [Actinomycetota bacterium]TMK93200.1 MAG: TRAM domain-containing protein [Actinomycetota bacterium]TMM23751.1 MAG: TRAM domain-containing protein [Actinomycetota bacterium]
MTVDEGRKATLRGRLVEAVRLIFVAVFGAVGYQLGTYATATTGGRAILYVFLGAASGYVCGGVFGRLTLEAVRGLEEEFSRRPAAEVAGGVVGLVTGLVVAALLCLPLLFIPVTLAWPAALFVFLVLGSLGIRLGQAKYEDLFGLFGMKPRATARAGGDVHVVDTSALIDGRIADLVSTGFISGTVLLHEGVLRELQAISDSSDPRRRTRGRRGLDVLVELQKAPTVQFQLVEEPGVQDVDAALVRLARERSASLITVDHNLAKVAEALRVPVAQINALASKFRLPYAAGDELVVRLVKDGREHGQGVGYLDDGTMVVVEDAAEHIGGQVEVQVRNVLQTTTGRMIFANIDAPAHSG